MVGNRFSTYGFLICAAAIIVDLLAVAMAFVDIWTANLVIIFPLVFLVFAFLFQHEAARASEPNAKKSSLAISALIVVTLLLMALGQSLARR